MIVDILALDDQRVSGGYGNKGASDPEDQLRLLEKSLNYFTKTTGSNLGNKCKNTTFVTSLSTILII